MKKKIRVFRKRQNKVLMAGGKQIHHLYILGHYIAYKLSVDTMGCMLLDFASFFCQLNKIYFAVSSTIKEKK